ncbi:cob(II)yrinic acid a,c-diamide reductase [Shimia isoporae]|uniref:Cob(II)yrinic acid a,c-diamide reductase n=1 Tax=Shimia isoporae TaxID=647720 RepID=A0A4R1NSX4_9RHOB|nr:5,6-dimethylbenzimidazole synthase [Shimia isoporae]TCL08032.1 cob(II)yrinic acid a,c-diamide reductase [Shimia isoporae]
MSDFSQDFRSDLTRLMQWRRDVRRFRTDPVDEALLTECLSSFLLAPSVGLSEPWRVVRVRSEAARAAALRNYETANAEALASYSDDRAALYARLKLSGMREAPEQLAVYCDDSTPKGAGLGAATMPEMRRYSVVGAITQFWLTARAHGLGVGWVSILDPVQLNNDLDVPSEWSLVAYLCVGWPETLSDTPELAKVGWEERDVDLPVQNR